jgi:hypothetical protein
MRWLAVRGLLQQGRKSSLRFGSLLGFSHGIVASKYLQCYYLSNPRMTRAVQSYVLSLKLCASDLLPTSKMTVPALDVDRVQARFQDTVG